MKSIFKGIIFHFVTLDVTCLPDLTPTITQSAAFLKHFYQFQICFTGVAPKVYPVDSMRIDE